MSLTTNVSQPDFPDLVLDTNVNQIPVIDVFRGIANMEYVEAKNPHATAAYLQVFDTLSVTMGTTTPVMEVRLAGLTTVHIKCSVGFSKGVSYGATSTAGGAIIPAGVITLKIMGAV